MSKESYLFNLMRMQELEEKYQKAIQYIKDHAMLGRNVGQDLFNDVSPIVEWTAREALWARKLLRELGELDNGNSPNEDKNP